MAWILLLVVGGIAAVACCGLTGQVLRLLRARQVLDEPTARSSHVVATPRGGGLAITAVGVLVWLVLILTRAEPSPAAWALPALWLALAGLSFVDDMRGLPVLLRLSGQIAAVAGGLALLPDEARLLQGLVSYWPDRIAAGLLWLWFVNLYNFMDGIDGIAVVETVGLGSGIAIVAVMLGLAAPDPLLGAALAGAAIGFGFWNWPPAKLFMGDVGSIGLGFVLGWLLLQLACAGHWLPALILPLYYLADASLTLARRACRLQPVWRAHRSHYYQQAAARMGSHAAVSLRVAAVNALLIAVAVIAVLYPELAYYCLLFAGGVCGLLLWYFHGIGAADPHR